MSFRLSTSATVVCDGSYSRSGGAGVGVAGRVGNKLMFVSSLTKRMTSSTQTEMKAVEKAIHECMSANHFIREILIYSDCKSVVDAFNGRAAKALSGGMDDIFEVVNFFEIAVSMRWVKSHSAMTPLQRFNSAAHNLANIAREKKRLRVMMPIQADWMREIEAKHPSIVKRDLPFSSTFSEVVDMTGLKKDVVLKLVQFGHLIPNNDGLFHRNDISRIFDEIENIKNSSEKAEALELSA